MCEGYSPPLFFLHPTYLDDEVADHSAVVGVHAGPEGVEDAGHAHLQVQLRLVGVPATTQRKKGPR